MRSVRDMVPEAAQDIGDPGQLISAALGAQPGGAGAQVGAEPLGSLTGAPPRTIVRVVQVSPAGVLGAPTQIVQPTRDSRVISLVAPFVGFSIFVGDAGIKVGDLSLPPGLPYDIVIPGFQELYAVTDAPVFLPLRVQIAAILIGDRERRFYPAGT